MSFQFHKCNAVTDLASLPVVDVVVIGERGLARLGRLHQDQSGPRVGIRVIPDRREELVGGDPEYGEDRVAPARTEE